MKILCAGLAVCDILIKPVGESCLKVDTSKVDTIALKGGGDAFNVAVNLASLGVKSALATRIGKDEFGQILTEQAQNAGVDTTMMCGCKLATSSTAVLIQENGQRSFLSFKGAAHTFTEKDISNDALKEFDCLYIGSAFDLPALDGMGMANLLKRAQKAKLKTALDTTGEAKDFQLLRPALAYVNYFLPSIREALSLSRAKSAEDAARFFHTNGAKTVIIKMGAEGCLISENGNQLRVPAYPSKVVDTTGAGDAFVAGFLAACCNGLSLRGCGALGNAAGAECVSKLGASGTLSSYELLNNKYLLGNGNRKHL